MSYQVLARKWRPRIFREMVGQEHVLTALINALDNNRLHHAYLFTGTRGVGKTTIARILAKCLNCEVGVSSEPCDQCAACREINEGRFVDLIEVDAASRTKVEDTRDLLDNVQYAPTKGRFKVYLIDEVHMLSGHSFNALLKTLEEPPPHVKFLLATTDPQKLPVTILSRCLQFNLKNMAPEHIVGHLQHVLEQEQIPFETPALWQLGRSADGSMRDALSLTDQAIAFGNGKVDEADVVAMLGTIDQRQVYDILQALADNDGEALLACVERLADHSPDYGDALASLISLLHRVAIAQVLPESTDNTFGDREDVLNLAQSLVAEDVQLFYQTALLGRRDLPLSPDARGGFEMVLLRMLAFRPQGASLRAKSSPPAPRNRADTVPSTPKSGEQEAASQPAKKPEASAQPSPALAESPPVPISENIWPDTPETAVAEPAPTVETTRSERRSVDVEESVQDEPKPTEPVVADQIAPAKPIEAARPPEPREIPQPLEAEPPKSTESEPAKPSEPAKMVNENITTLSVLTPDNWNALAEQLPVAGVIQNTVRNCQLLERDANVLQFVLDERNSTLYDESHQQRLSDILSDYFAESVTAKIQVGTVTGETPAAANQRLQSERQALALETIQNDPRVQELISTFSATLREDSVTPLDG